MEGMSYDVGTHISFKKKDSETSQDDSRRLYIPGTRIVFVSFIPTLKTLTIAPQFVAPA